ncbi:MAG TPA: hypothetical protein DCX07_07280 [Phycisphaerales bacterium]|nr:hypothetical protein [Phycisphaerales bacterium]
MIRIEDVSYEYASGKRAIDGVTLEFRPGTISAVLGESGSGKTTMLMCLGRFLRPQRGAITLDGKDVFELPEAEFRRKVGIVFQKLYLFPHLTVLENMVLAPVHALSRPSGDARHEAMEMLDRLGIADIAASYPAQVSGGQAQRAAIARGLLLRPEYMLLDEPTSALDANTTDAFAEWLADLKDVTNFVIVTHDILFARKLASDGVYLSGGKVLDSGRVDDMIRHVRAGQLVEAGGRRD